MEGWGVGVCLWLRTQDACGHWQAGEVPPRACGPIRTPIVDEDDRLLHQATAKADVAGGC